MRGVFGASLLLLFGLLGFLVSGCGGGQLLGVGTTTTTTAAATTVAATTAPPTTEQATTVPATTVIPPSTAGDVRSDCVAIARAHDDIFGMVTPAFEKDKGIDVAGDIAALQGVEQRWPEIRPALEDLIYMLNKINSAAPGIGPDKALTPDEIGALNKLFDEAVARLGGITTTAVPPNIAALNAWGDAHCAF